MSILLAFQGAPPATPDIIFSYVDSPDDDVGDAGEFDGAPAIAVLDDVAAAGNRVDESVEDIGSDLLEHPAFLTPEDIPPTPLILRFSEDEEYEDLIDVFEDRQQNSGAAAGIEDIIFPFAEIEALDESDDSRGFEESFPGISSSFPSGSDYIIRMRRRRRR